MEHAQQTKPPSGDIGVYGASAHVGLGPRKTGLLSQMDRSKLVMTLPIVIAVATLTLVGYWASSPRAQTGISNNKTADAVLSELSAGPGSWEGDGKTQKVAAQLRGELRQKQVPAAQLRGSPFTFGPGMPAPTTGTSTKPSDPLSAEMAKVNSASEKLQLESILVGTAGPAAVISGQTVNEGQEIDGWTVTKIQPRKVTLTWKSYTVTLTLR